MILWVFRQLLLPPVVETYISHIIRYMHTKAHMYINFHCKCKPQKFDICMVYALTYLRSHKMSKLISILVAIKYKG